MEILRGFAQIVGKKLTEWSQHPNDPNRDQEGRNNKEEPYRETVIVSGQVSKITSNKPMTYDDPRVQALLQHTLELTVEDQKREAEKEHGTDNIPVNIEGKGYTV